jgi:hypothetical protein
MGDVPAWQASVHSGANHCVRIGVTGDGMDASRQSTPTMRELCVVAGNGGRRDNGRGRQQLARSFIDDIDGGKKTRFVAHMTHSKLATVTSTKSADDGSA